MSTLRCPGQDRRFWKPKDIFEVQCPYCEHILEFWKDDPLRHCSNCSKEVRNPRIDLGCAKWCQFAEDCLGFVSDESIIATPVVERVIAMLAQRLTAYPNRMKYAREVCSLAERIMISERGDPCLVKVSALFIGLLLTETGDVTEITPLQNSPLSDLDFRKTILEQVGIETSMTDEICAVIEAVISGKPLDMPEFDIVWDAVQLERSLLRHASTAFTRNHPALIKTIRTQSGKQIAAQYNQPPNTVAEGDSHA